MVFSFCGVGFPPNLILEPFESAGDSLFGVERVFHLVRTRFFSLKEPGEKTIPRDRYPSLGVSSLIRNPFLERRTFRSPSFPPFTGGPRDPLSARHLFLKGFPRPFPFSFP